MTESGPEGGASEYERLTLRIRELADDMELGCQQYRIGRTAVGYTVVQGKPNMATFDLANKAMGGLCLTVRDFCLNASSDHWSEEMVTVATSPDYAGWTNAWAETPLGFVDLTKTSLSIWDPQGFRLYGDIDLYDIWRHSGTPLEEQYRLLVVDGFTVSSRYFPDIGQHDYLTYDEPAPFERLDMLASVLEYTRE